LTPSPSPSPSTGRVHHPVYDRILLARQSVPVTFTDALVLRYLAETVDC
jgi:hypothetical protein